MVKMGKMPDNTGHQVFISYSTRDKLSEKSDYTEWDLLGIKASETVVNNIHVSDRIFERGILVEEVDVGSPASWDAICPGDVIVTVNGKPVKTVEELRNHANHSREMHTPLSVEVTRQETIRSIKMTISDRPVADIIHDRLESENIPCWIDHRNIVPGARWVDAIINALSQSKIMILVFSSNTDKSHWVESEVQHALSKNITIIPFCIGDVPPKSALKFLVGNRHWIKAHTPPLEKHLRILIDAVRTQLEKIKKEKPLVIEEPARYKINESLFVIPGTNKVIVNLQKKKIVRMGRLDELDTDAEIVNDINFLFYNISVSHLQLRFKNSGELYIQDTGSSFGTFVNEQRLHPCKELKLKNGDIIRMGKLIVFELFEEQGFFLLKHITHQQKEAIVTLLSNEPGMGKNLPETNTGIVLIKDCAPIVIPGTDIQLEIDKDNGDILSDNEMNILSEKIII